MSRSDSPTEPPQGYAFPSNVDPPWATPPGLPGSSTDRSPRAVPNYPGEPGGCGHPLLHHRWQASSRMAAWPLSVCVTRPNRVRLRYGSRVRLRQASSGESLHRPLARLPVEWVITGQAPFSLQDQPGLSWHSIHRAFCDVCEPRRSASRRTHGKHRHVCATPIRDGRAICEAIDFRTHSGFVPDHLRAPPGRPGARQAVSTLLLDTDVFSYLFKDHSLADAFGLMSKDTVWRPRS